MALTAEDFARWREDPVTRFVFAAIERNADECREKWVEASWRFNNPNPVLLSELRTRADANRALIDTTYEGWCESMDAEPIYPE